MEIGPKWLNCIVAALFFMSNVVDIICDIDCGTQDLQGLETKDTEFSRREHPWAVVFMKSDGTGTGKLTYLCGGVLIDQSKVLTGKYKK